MNSKRSVLFSSLTVIIVFGLSVTVLFMQSASLAAPSATISVTTGADIISDDGLCSLREAIRSANTDTAIGGCAAGNGSDVITLDTSTYILSIEGTNEDLAFTGDLDITDDLEIRGKGASSTYVSADGIDRVFHVDPDLNGIQVAFYNLTIENGDIFDGTGGEEDASGGGGVLSNASLLLDGVSILNSEATRGGGVRVTETGDLEILNSVIQGNFAQIEGGGIYGDAPITLQNVQVLENESNRGGGISCDLDCVFSDLTLSQNEAQSGGGIYVDSTTEISNSTINGNVALNQGGGIYNEDDLTLTNVTLSNNYSQDEGSAIFSEAFTDLRNVTIYENNSLPGSSAAVTNDIGGIFELSNTIIGENFPQDCSSGDLQSFGGNMDSDNTCDLAHDTDLHDVNPRLGSLQNNGGATNTHAPLPNSPAIDAGLNISCPLTDQRGYPRPADGNGDNVAQCDSGAVELSPGGILRITPLTILVEDEAAGDGGTVQLTVKREGSSEGNISVKYFTWEGLTDDRAHEDADYIGRSGQLTWNDGDNSDRYITIEIVDDQAYELDEIFFVALSSPTGGASLVSTSRVSTITILENDSEYPPATPFPEPERKYLPSTHQE